VPADNSAPEGADGGARAGDELTVLHTHGSRMATKRISAGPDGEPVIQGYDEAAHFKVSVAPVGGITDLAGTIAELQHQPHAFVVRAEPLPGIDLNHTRRLVREKWDPATGEILAPTFKEVARRWLALDFDTLPLPQAFDWRDGELAALHLIRFLPRHG
jgi:hypothetical protein